MKYIKQGNLFTESSTAGDFARLNALTNQLEDLHP